MAVWAFFHFILSVCFCIHFLIATSLASHQYVDHITPGFVTSQSNWTDKNGMFLLSKNLTFSFGFYTTVDSPLFVLVVMHVSSKRVIWTANRGKLVNSSDKFVFDGDGNAYLENGTANVWSSYTAGKGGKAMELWNNGNLVLVCENRTILWQSFSHPTDTLISGQKLNAGMKVRSFPEEGLSSYLEIRSGDVMLYAGYDNPQPYWSMSKDSRKVVRQTGGKVSWSSMANNSWNFYDEKRELVWQFNISDQVDPDALWTAVLDSQGSIQFCDLHKGTSAAAASTKIPQDSCDSPTACAPYQGCFSFSTCVCPRVLSSLSDNTCKLQVPGQTCDTLDSKVRLQDVGERLNYSVLGFVEPQLRGTSRNACKEACLHNCSCSALFYENSSRSCFLFEQIGSFERPEPGSTGGFMLSIKVSIDGGKDVMTGRAVAIIVIIAVLTVLIICVLVVYGLWYLRRRKRLSQGSESSSDEDNFFHGFPGMPVRFSYSDLQKATKNFSAKLGRGGFGSVYLGVLPDGTKLAVKKLERIGQGRKEFRAEVNIIGGIRHVHLVKLKGFCAEGSHRLLVYEYLANGSLDRWIFRKSERGILLDWDTRFNILLATAKALAYLHEECEVKIVHCDIKPENILLDDRFVARVSDFGLAKLMNREQSHVVTTLRGTRGYLAPEWITNCAISEKSDVYSYGMVLLEVIGGRKNYDAEMCSSKSHFPSYAFRMMKEGKPKEIIDPSLNVGDEALDERVLRAIKVALLCIQVDITSRPPMSKVVQMLEGLCSVPQPQLSGHTASRLYSGLFNSSSDDIISLCRTVEYSESHSADQLSGPR